MNRQSLMALGIAVFIGLIAVILANAFLKGSADGRTPEGMVKVAVAAVPLDFGMPLRKENIRFINYPKNELPAGSFTNAAELIGPGKERSALMPIAANELILAGKVTGEGAGASIASLLPKGKRAVSVKINDVSGVAGFIQPNDSVDVLITRQIAGRDREQQVTDVLLQNTRVMAMGKRAKNDAAGKPASAKTATLEVTPLEAQKLALGQQVGDLSLVLRKPGEQDDALAISTVSLEDLRYGTYAGTYRPQLAAANLAAPPPSPGWTPARAPRATARKPVAKPVARPVTQTVRNSVDVVRGTTQTSYEVGSFGG